MKKVKYIILGHERSGTTITAFLIKDHPLVSAPRYEVGFTPFYDQGINAYTLKKNENEINQNSFNQLFDVLSGVNQKESTTTYGIKTAINRPEAAKVVYNTVTNYLDKDIRIIFVHRENLTAQYGSFLRALKSGYWHTWQQNNEVTDLKITADRKAFIQYVINALKINSILKKLENSCKFISLSYEKDILPNNIENFYKVYDFLGLAYPDIQFPLQKVAPGAEDYMVNYSALRHLESEIKEDFKADKILHWLDETKPQRQYKFQNIKYHCINRLIKILNTLK